MNSEGFRGLKKVEVKDSGTPSEGYEGMERILIVDDNEDLSEAIGSLLEADYSVFLAHSLEQARAQLNEQPIDLVILDMGLPDGEGTHLCAYMKDDERFKDIPVIFLSGRGATDDKIVAFSVGADDYVLKPFEGRELKARIRARLNTSKKQDKGGMIVCGNLMINTLSQKVTLKEKPTELRLTSLEFRLLLHFARHEDQVFPRDRLISSIWGENISVLDRTIDRHVSDLRKKLTGSTHTIETVRGTGYRLSKIQASAKKSRTG